MSDEPPMATMPLQGVLQDGYRRSTGAVPNFFASNEVALADMRRAAVDATP